MADYWKSHAKKFCDFCKCWIADNKPSIQFHESGKKHKENVTKRLGEISKNSAKSYKESLQLDQDMKKMEEEAFKAYMKDLQENPDYTSKRIVEESERKSKELEERLKKEKSQNSPKFIDSEEATSSKATPEAYSSKVWHEAKSEEGHTYFWNLNTGESKWDVPKEGFISIEEQENEQRKSKLKQDIKRKIKKEKSNNKEVTEKGSVKKRKKKKIADSLDVMVGPAPKPEPLGPWIVVEPKIEEKLDLELPQQEYVAINVPALTEPEIKFKEKTVMHLEKDQSKYHGFVKSEIEPSEMFKKRKFNRGNIRQKLDAD